MLSGLASPERMSESLPGKLLVALLHAPPEKMAAVEQVLFAGEAQEGQAATAAQAALVPGGLAERRGAADVRRL